LVHEGFGVTVAEDGAGVDLIDAVWGYDEAGWDTSGAAVNTCVAKLRAKIEPDPATPRYIHSMHVVGYRFKAL
jgi:two-component system response regulator RegX3